MPSSLVRCTVACSRHRTSCSRALPIGDGMSRVPDDHTRVLPSPTIPRAYPPSDGPGDAIGPHKAPSAAYSTTIAAGVALACVGLLLQAMQDNFALPLVVGLRLGWVSALDLSRQLLSTLVIVLLVVAGATLLPFLAVSIPVGLLVLPATVLLVR